MGAAGVAAEADDFVSAPDAPGSGGNGEAVTEGAGDAVEEDTGAFTSGMAGSAGDEDAEEEDDADGRLGSPGMLVVSGNFSSVMPPPAAGGVGTPETEGETLGSGGKGGAAGASAAWSWLAKRIATVERSVLVSIFMMPSYF
jgi:hypothetical protein